MHELPDHMLAGAPAVRPGFRPNTDSRTPVNLLDWLLLVLVLAYALSGYWQGFVTGAFATTGLLLGGLLGIWLAPCPRRRRPSSGSRWAPCSS